MKRLKRWWCRQFGHKTYEHIVSACTPIIREERCWRCREYRKVLYDNS